MKGPTFQDLNLDGIELEPTANIVEVEIIKIETLTSFIGIAQPVAEKKEVD
ncbi:hypothetical protein [Paenibacillus sp. L3-i20]|uniref:hypothetical protein n=1 Tax=Paenibacillus sp. L3-i20 TaxID=2905833 RepID=UPI001EDD56A3|nr:hypothetical protein [Paenibacillus sp. L3-i20]GKU80181.1 hypothetical protein L3i20_v245780 [Paenibacillus sp. L3-i20]